MAVADGGECEFFTNPRITGKDTGHIHHLREPEDSLSPDKWPEVGSIQYCSAGFGGGGRDAGGEQVPDIDGGTFPSFEHEFESCSPGHVGDLVRICHNGRCPVECDQPGIFPGGQERALDVHVGIDKAGDNVLS